MYNNEIAIEIHDRNITRLCHFVHTNLLLHILNSEEGIKAVNFIDKDILEQNDQQRLDGKKDYVNCSVQYPNYWYFKKVQNNNQVFPDWAVIFIDPIVSTYETTEFCSVNAATRFGAYIERGYEAFSDMFANRIEKGKFAQIRKPMMLSHAPTDDQAEVLIYKNIPLKFITGIAFMNEDIAREKKAAWEVLDFPNYDIFIAPELFTRAASDKIRQGILPHEYKYMEG